MKALQKLTICCVLLSALGAHARDDIEPYDRDLYRHWIDSDGDCVNTRHEVLINESLTIPTMDDDECKVAAGLWFDPYTGRFFEDPTELDVDHLVPLKEAHESGGHAWSASKRRDYANDMADADTLIAVYKSANRSKGARDPANWMPENTAWHCAYIKRWSAVKARWNLSMDAVEARWISRYQSNVCK